MSSEEGNIVAFVRRVNHVRIDQRIDGYINGTAMCVAHGKDISDWLRTDDTWELVVALAEDLGIKPNSVEKPNSVKTRVSATYPTLVVVKRGSPENGGGTWLHPDLAVYLAQKCNKPFAIQVSRWIREWLATAENPIQSSLDQEFTLWRQRYDIRVYLKDFLRPELMDATLRWAKVHRQNPISLCAGVHDLMNERIQGMKSKQLKLLHGLPLGDLIRDYFDASPLVSYVAINKLAKNAIEDRGLHPFDAVNEACDHFLGKSYTPKPAPLAENLYAQGHRLKAARRQKHLPQGTQLQLPLWDGDEAC